MSSQPEVGSQVATSSMTSRATARRTSLSAHGMPMVWLTGGALAISLAMIVGLLSIVLWYGLSTFWPGEIVRFATAGGDAAMGELATVESFRPSPERIAALPEEMAEEVRARLAEQDGLATRYELRIGNFDLTGAHYAWIPEYLVEVESRPEWALVIERLTWGRFYGEPQAFVVEGEVLATDPAEIWSLVEEYRPEVRRRWLRARELEEGGAARIHHKLDRERLRLRSAELEHGTGSAEYEAAREHFQELEAVAETEFDEISSEIRALENENERYVLRMRTASEEEQDIVLSEIVRAYPANQLGLVERTGIYLSRWWEFLTEDPREANSEGGVFPAIFGTVAMTLVMSLLVVPFGVLAALYLREYAKQGFIVSVVRIAVNNLAGVPSIVFGVFGLGFFCYIIGGGVDEWFFPEKLPTPTFGKGGLLWAALTLSLLTLPVVIVATEEALSAVPSSMREGSYGCGATKWQTIRRIVLPRAMPGIMTGMILAIARGAGEVAPLMLVGAVKLAPELPVSLMPPFGSDRSFMHLGFHIYDLGFQSQNSEAAKPMVYTTTLLLIGIVVLLNVVAIWIRSRLRRRFSGGTI